ncbi:MAG: TrbG/VirB9 family P-type conjugative transfer protein [Acidobacteriota bacterium]|nr:TrbG/VirB9 family P-type conjugative transfer protein [Acidobacteriota bacterium]
MSIFTRRSTTVLVWFLTVPFVLAEEGVVKVAEQEDQIIEVRTRVRHTTVLVLPIEEKILDFVVGDAGYWHLSGAANLAYIKPLAEGVRTNVALVCASGRIYSFLATEGGTPHLVVRVEREPKEKNNLLISSDEHQPAFVSRSEVEGYREMARQASEAVRSVQAEADTRVDDAKRQARAEVDRFRSEYPEELTFPYRLDKNAGKRPFLVEAMWHDGRFTYLRSGAQESPALYELKDGRPSLVAYDLTADGLYIARHVVGDGWLQIGKKKARWRFDSKDARR